MAQYIDVKGIERMSSREEKAGVVVKSIGYFLFGGVIFFCLLYVSAHIYFYYKALPKITSDTMYDDSDVGEIIVEVAAKKLASSSLGI